MKKLMSVLLFVTLALFSSAEVFAGRTEDNIKQDTGGEIRIPRTSPVRCFSDKEAGYVELHLSSRLGELSITITDSTGDIVDQAIVDTAVESFVILNLPDPEESYVVEIVGERYSGAGVIE